MKLATGGGTVRTEEGHVSLAVSAARTPGGGYGGGRVCPQGTCTACLQLQRAQLSGQQAVHLKQVPFADVHQIAPSQEYTEVAPPKGQWGGTLLTACNCRMLKAYSHQKKRTATEGWRQTLPKVRRWLCCLLPQACMRNNDYNCTVSCDLSVHGCSHGPNSRQQLGPHDRKQVQT